MDYTYDKVGNRTTLSENSTTTSYDYEVNSNHLSQVNASPITTDPNGNLTHNGRYTIEHTTDNRVKRIVDGTIEKARYVYNGLGQRVQKITATQTINYLYGLNGELLAEFNTSQQLLKQYIYFNGQPMAFVDKDVNNDFIPDATVAVVRYIHNDHLGTPKIVTDNNGVIVWSAKAKPFGYATVNADVDGDGVNVVFNLRQPGQYFDVESGFYYNYFRYYDPELGRYITSDPIGLAGGINTYAYVGGNPLSYIDPYGLEAMTVTTAWMLRLGGGVSLFAPVPGARPFGISLLAMSMTGDTPDNSGSGSGAFPAGSQSTPASPQPPGDDDDPEQCSPDDIGLSKKGLKHLGRHTNDFKRFDPNFTIQDQVALGRQIAGNPRNLVNIRNGSRGFEAIVNIGGNNVRVRAVLNSSNNLRNVFPILR